MSDQGVEWVDLGLEQFLKNMRVLDQTSVQVGFVGPAAAASEPSGRITVAEAGLIAEYGASRAGIPARRPIRGTITPEFAQHHGEDVGKAVANFQDPVSALDAAGKALAEAISGRILRGDFEGNTSSTVQKKGFDHPLLETGALVGAVGHRIVRGSGDTVESGASPEEFEAFEIGGQA